METPGFSRPRGGQKRPVQPPTTERAMGSLKSDVRHAFRALVKAPVFTAVVVVTLALGIGANSAIFSLVNAVLLRPLGYAEPERLMLIYEGFRGSAFGKIG